MVDLRVPHKPAISVVIPTLNEASGIAATLASVAVADIAHEIIVVDGNSADATTSLVAGAGGRVISAPRAQRGAQMNLGAARATAEILLFLHADTILPPDALRAICCALRDPQVVGGAFARRYASPSPLLAATCWLADFRSRVLGWHLGDQAIFVRRKIFEHCGRFAEVARFEDLDFSRKLRARGRVVTLWPPVVSSARRFAKDGALLRTAKDLALVLRYHLLGLPSAKTLPSTTTPPGAHLAMNPGGASRFR